jgi:uncharacterized protein with HEPN domain
MFPKQPKISFFDIPWLEMKSLRNLLIHEYFTVDVGEVWNSYLNDLPSLKEQIDVIVSWHEKNNFHKP